MKWFIKKSCRIGFTVRLFSVVRLFDILIPNRVFYFGSKGVKKLPNLLRGVVIRDKVFFGYFEGGEVVGYKVYNFVGDGVKFVDCVLVNGSGYEVSVDRCKCIKVHLWKSEVYLSKMVGGSLVECLLDACDVYVRRLMESYFYLCRINGESFKIFMGCEVKDSFK